jgi:hypothetical protein
MKLHPTSANERAAEYTVANAQTTSAQQRRRNGRVLMHKRRPVVIERAGAETEVGAPP